MPEDDLHSVAQATLAGDSTAPEDAPDSKNQPEDLLSLAERLYEGQIWGVPGGSEAAKAEGSPGGQLGRQTLVVQMHIAAKNRDWWKVRICIPVLQDKVTSTDSLVVCKLRSRQHLCLAGTSTERRLGRKGSAGKLQEASSAGFAPLPTGAPAVGRA